MATVYLIIGLSLLAGTCYFSVHTWNEYFRD